MKLGPVIQKMMKNTEKDAFEKDIKPLLTITITQGEQEEDEGEPDEQDETENPLMMGNPHNMNE